MDKTQRVGGSGQGRCAVCSVTGDAVNPHVVANVPEAITLVLA
jgi:hypothetical protein